MHSATQYLFFFMKERIFNIILHILCLHNCVSILIFFMQTLLQVPKITVVCVWEGGGVGGGGSRVVRRCRVSYVNWAST